MVIIILLARLKMRSLQRMLQRKNSMKILIAFARFVRWLLPLILFCHNITRKYMRPYDDKVFIAFIDWIRF